MMAIMARAAFATTARRLTSPAAVLADINRNMHGLTGEHFVTAFYGLFDRYSRRLTYANAGQPYPFLYRASEKSCQTLSAHGLMLGIMEEADYEEKSVQLEPGDRLLMYTDGVVDCVNEQGEHFGVQRLEQCLIESATESARSLAQGIADRLRAFRGTRPATDDITLVTAGIR
jgi:serine phosphatase RsbU (regulator of sigma subunit)